TEAVFEALVLGSTLSVAVWTIFAFDQPLLNARPVGSRLIALWMWIAYTPIILGGRGSEIQGLAGALLLIVAAFIAGRLLVWPKMLDRTPRLTPLVIFAVTILAVFLLSFEDHELDFMPDELILSVMAAWLAALVGVALIRLVWTVTRFQPAAGGMGLWIAALLLGALAIFGYERAEGPIVQPRALFVVMADQSNTAPLSQLADRDVRVAAVYEQLTQHANETQSDVRGWLDGREVTYTPFYLVNGLEVEGNLFLRWQLIFREDVAYVIESPRNRPVRAISFGAEEVELDPDELLGSMSDPPAEVTWGIDAIQADRVWTELGVRGEGVVVGIADSGSDWTHPNLGPAYRGIDGGEHDYNWFDPELGTTEPTDSGSHGTHVAGTVVGQNNTGVAPGAQWIACRNLPRNLGNPADYIACMEFLFAPFPLGGDPFTEGDPLRGAHLTNNSWGCPPIEGCDGRTVGIGVNHLRNAGQLMVVAAGNAGPSCQTSDVPAMGDAAFSVGAIESDITVAAFSSRGPGIDINGELIVKPDIMAPGVDVISSIPGNRYAAFPGTSMASPHVAGVVALLWSANPALIGDIEATEEILRSTTQEIDISITSTNQCGPPTEPMTGNVIGAGLINAYAAVEQALQGR
ncbi:MAG: S8 family serine peptidase, partial [Chloroflexota bacterium]